MSILSWLGGKRRFTRRSAVDEFKALARAEKKRRTDTDDEFDAAQFDKAVELVLRRLQKRGRRE